MLAPQSTHYYSFQCCKESSSSLLVLNSSHFTLKSSTKLLALRVTLPIYDIVGLVGSGDKANAAYIFNDFHGSVQVVTIRLV